MTAGATHTFIELAQGLRDAIASGVLQPGDRLPSVRCFAAEHGIGVATALRAYRRLEEEGHIVPRHGAGFFVEDAAALGAPAPTSRRGPAPDSPLLAPLPRAAKRALEAVNERLVRLARRDPSLLTGDFPPQGDTELRRQIARRLLAPYGRCEPQDLLITAGGGAMVTLALIGLTPPDAAIALCTPCAPHLIEAVQRSGRRIVEVPWPDGPDLALLDRLLRAHTIAVCVIAANCPAPTGRSLPEACRHEVVRLLERYGVLLIEDDSGGELAHLARAPLLARHASRDTHLVCGDFAVSLGLGRRIGWILGGAHARRLSELAGMFAAPPPLIQRAVEQTLRCGDYERHLRALRREMYAATIACISALRPTLPHDALTLPPDGGSAVWITFADVPAATRWLIGADRSATVTGDLFSASRHYSNSVQVRTT